MRTVAEPSATQKSRGLARAVGCALAPEQVSAFELYAHLLLEANRRTNLISRRDEPRLWTAHLFDSLAAAQLLAPAEAAIDLGSGAGLPGIPLAIAHPEVAFLLVEPRRLRAAFLKQAVCALGLSNVRVYPGSARRLAREASARPDGEIVVARGLGSVERVVELAAPLVSSGGRVAVFKGAAARLEMKAARCRWPEMAFRLWPYRVPGGRTEGALVEAVLPASSITVTRD